MLEKIQRGLAWWSRVEATGDQEYRRGRFLSFFILGVLFVCLGLIVINLRELWLGQDWYQSLGYELINMVGVVLLLWVWRLNRSGHVRIAGLIYLLALTFGPCLATSLDELDRIMTIYAVPILSASFLIHPAASFLIAILSSLGYYGIYLQNNGPLSLNYISIMLFFVVALASWLIADLLEQDIAERKQAELALQSNEAHLKTSLAEKETLLRELYHRTGNNMQVICSLLSLQAEKFQEPHILNAFRDTENRIHALSLINQKLYQSHDLSSIDLGEYLYELAMLLVGSYRVDPEQITLQVEVESLSVLMDTAIPCGLIVNELVANALEHAFPDERQGNILIRLWKEQDDICLEVSDNGIGLPAGIDLHNLDTLGYKTIFALGKHQLHGQISFQDRAQTPGFACQLRFQDTLYRARV